MSGGDKLRDAINAMGAAPAPTSGEHAIVPALRFEGLAGGHGRLTVFREASATLAPGSTTGILGANGAGKTTLLKTLCGLLPAHAGRAWLGVTELGPLAAWQRSRAGLALVPEGRQVIAGLTVAENLELSRAATGLSNEAYSRRLAEVHALFPRLAERSGQASGSLSGGEQQMLAIGRALMLAPSVLMLDEPTQGLAPVVVRQVLEALQSLKGRYTMLVIEQNRAFAEALVDRTLSLRGGRLEPQ
jgi:branched-chain amino acid transport system ATP-binding protein